jgi:hypothetical protein
MTSILQEFLDVKIAHNVSRRYIMATEFPSQEALSKYLEDHPEAEKSNHTVKPSSKDSYGIEGASWSDKDQKTYKSHLPQHKDQAMDSVTRNLKKIFHGKTLKGPELKEAILNSGVLRNKYQAKCEY